MPTDKSDRDETHKEIRALKEARNQATPVFKLPPEILSLVFKHVNMPCSLSRKSPWRDATKVAQICRHWRTIALGCPSLWSQIDFTSIRVIKKMLSRAKVSQLIVSTDYSGIVSRLSPSICARLLDMDRLQELELSLSPRHLHRFLKSSSGTNAMDLRLLSLSYRMHSDNSGSLGAAYTLPAKIISMPMPHLQHLKLSNCKIPWDSMHSTYHELTTLKLVYIRNEPTRKQFFLLLSKSPKLEQLQLISTLPTPSSDAICDVQLPKLSSCFLEFSSVAQCLDFQAHVSYPVDTANIFINLSDSRPKVDASSVKALITSCGTSSPNHRHSHMVLSMTEIFAPCIVLSPARSEYFAGFPSPYSVAINLQYTEHITGSDHTSCVLDVTLVAGLQSLSLRAPRGAHRLQNATQWSNFFNRHGQITELYIESASILSILSALSSPMGVTGAVALNGDEDNHPVSHPDTPTSLPLPDLVTLALRGHGIVKYLPDDTRYSAETCQLLSYLAMRRQCGCPIQKLELWCCMGMDDELVEALRAEVVEIVWDGIFMRRAGLDDSDEDSEEDSEDSEDDYYCYY